MIDRDHLLHRVMAANPLPDEHPLPDGLDDWRPPLAILMSEETPVDAPDRSPILPMPDIGDELLSTERSRSMDTQQRPKVQDTPSRTGWRTAAIAFAAIILVVGAVVGVAALIRNGDDDVVAGAAVEPTLTFDGTTATYSGPETFQTGTEVAVTLVNTSDESVKFLWVRLDEEHAGMTLEELRPLANETVGVAARNISPPGGVPARTELHAEVRLPVEGAYALGAEAGQTDEQGLYTEVFHLAVIIQVTDG